MPSVSLAAAVLMMALALAAPAGAQAPPPLTQVADTPPQVGASMVIAPPGGLCRELVTQFATVGGPRGDLRDRCTELVQNATRPELETEVQTGLEQMAGVQGTALGTAKTNSAVQFANITARLSALRLGGAGIGLGGLALDAPEPLPGPRVASLGGKEIAQLTGGAAAGAGPKWGVFLNGAWTTGDVDATSREAGFDFDGGGVTGGVDYRLTPSLILGIALGYAGTSADFQDDAGKVDVDDLSVSLYGTYYATNQFYVDGIATVGWSSYDLERRIRYSIPTVPAVGTGITTVDQVATADPDGFGFGIGAAAGYDFHWGALTAGPIGRVNYARSEVDGYREQINAAGAGFGLALDVESQTVESLVTGLGAQVSYAVSTAIGVIVPQLRFEWVHEFLNDARTYKSRFVNDPTPSAATTIQWGTDAPDRDFFNLGAGVAATFARGISAFVYYETVLDLRDVTQHRVAGGVRVEF
jgi:outer membrane lipase/esterase